MSAPPRAILSGSLKRLLGPIRFEPASGEASLDWAASGGAFVVAPDFSRRLPSGVVGFNLVGALWPIGAQK